MRDRATMATTMIVVMAMTMHGDDQEECLAKQEEHGDDRDDGDHDGRGGGDDDPDARPGANWPGAPFGRGTTAQEEQT